MQGNPHFWRMSLPRVAIIAVLVTQLMWFFLPRSGSHPLSPKAREAAIVYARNPTPATKMALDTMLLQEDRNVSLWVWPTMALLLVVDAAGIYYFWNYGDRMPSA